MVRLSIILPISLLAGLLNCYTGQIGNPSNTIFINKGNNGFSGTSFDAQDREGEACVTSIFALFAFGDASIQAAANKADIRTITSVSHDTKQNMFIMQDVCTVVRGR